VTDHRKPVPEIVLLTSCLSGLLLWTAIPAQAAHFASLHAPAVAAEGEADADAPAEKPKKKQYAEEAVKHYNRGVEFHQNGSLNQAIQEYKAAIVADGRLAEAYSNLGAVYLAQKSYDKAAEAFNKALALKPDKPTTLNGLGNALYARGKAAEAKDKWAKAVEIDPTFASAYYNMGNALESEKDEKAALAEYMKAIEANPKVSMPDAYYRIGGILHKTKHLAQSHVFLKKSLELAPNSDFVRDAQKMLKEQETEFTREAATKEVEMTVLPPTKESGTTTKKTGDSAVAAVEKKSTADKSAADKGATDSGAQRPRFPMFRRKAKEEKKVEMFVQPPGSADDLKPSPSEGGSTDNNSQTSNDAWK
jgi:tetratricopeptide (TPR) repeat protein